MKSPVLSLLALCSLLPLYAMELPPQRYNNLSIIWNNNHYDPTAPIIDNPDKPENRALRHANRIDAMALRLMAAFGQQAAPILTTSNTLREFFYRRFMWNGYERLLVNGVWHSLVGPDRFDRMHNDYPIILQNHRADYNTLCEFMARYGAIDQAAIDAWNRGERTERSIGWEYEKLYNGYNDVAGHHYEGYRDLKADYTRQRDDRDAISSRNDQHFCDDVEHYALSNLPLLDSEWRVFRHRQHPWLHLFAPIRYLNAQCLDIPQIMPTYPERLQASSLATADRWTSATINYFKSDPSNNLASCLSSLGFNAEYFQPITIDRLQAEVARNEIPLIDSNTPENHLPLEIFNTQKTIPWNIYWTGHGGPLRDIYWIAGMPSANFREALQFFNDSIKVSFFGYGTCFGGGYHTVEPYANLLREHAIDTTAWRDHRNLERIHFSISPLNFPIAVDATTDSPSHAHFTGSCFFQTLGHECTHPLCVNDNAPRALQRFGCRIDFNQFFDSLQDREGFHGIKDRQQRALRAISACFSDDKEAASDNHLIRYPGTHFFQAANITSRNYRLTFAVTKCHELRNEPIVVNDKRALLIYPPIIRVPVIFQTPAANPLPTIVSMNPEPAIHFFSELDIGDNQSFLKLLESLTAIGTTIDKIFIIKRLYSAGCGHGDANQRHGVILHKGATDAMGVTPVTIYMRQIGGTERYLHGTYDKANHRVNWNNLTQQEYTIAVNNLLELYSTRRNALTQLMNRVPAPHGRPAIADPDRPDSARATTHIAELVAPWQIHHEILKRYVRYQLAEYLAPRPVITDNEIESQRAEDRAVGALAARTPGDRAARTNLAAETEQHQAQAEQRASRQVIIRNPDPARSFYCTMVQRDGRDEPFPRLRATVTRIRPFEIFAQRNARCMLSPNEDASNSIELICNTNDLSGRVCDLTVTRNRENHLVVNPSPSRGSIPEDFIQRTDNGSIVIQTHRTVADPLPVNPVRRNNFLRIFNNVIDASDKTPSSLYITRCIHCLHGLSSSYYPKMETRQLCRGFNHIDLLLESYENYLELLEIPHNGHKKPLSLMMDVGLSPDNSNKVREIIVTAQNNQLILEAPSYSSLKSEDITHWESIRYASVSTAYPRVFLITPWDSPKQQLAIIFHLASGMGKVQVRENGYPSTFDKMLTSQNPSLIIPCHLFLQLLIKHIANDKNQCLNVLIYRSSFADKACELTICRRGNRLLVEPAPAAANNVLTNYIINQPDGSVAIRAPHPLACHEHEPILKTVTIRPHGTETRPTAYYSISRIDDNEIPEPRPWIAFDNKCPAAFSGRYMVRFQITDVQPGMVPNASRTCAITCFLNTLHNRVCNLQYSGNTIYGAGEDGIPKEFRINGFNGDFIHKETTTDGLTVIHILGPGNLIVESDTRYLYIRSRMMHPLYYSINDPAIPAGPRRSWQCLYPTEALHYPSQQYQILLSQHADGTNPITLNIDTRAFLPGEMPLVDIMQGDDKFLSGIVMGNDEHRPIDTPANLRMQGNGLIFNPRFRASIPAYAAIKQLGASSFIINRELRRIPQWSNLLGRYC